MKSEEVKRNTSIEEHQYDGIHELENRPPPWIMWLFYITVFWSAFYMAVFHVLKIGDLQEVEYDKEVVMAESFKKQNTANSTFDEQNIVLLKDNNDLQKGKELYDTKTCVTCHGASAEGNAVGPNLTDEYWLNGGKPENIFKIIKYGNTIKGMMAYKDQLTDTEMQQLTSYILVNLVGSNPPNPKAPQGEKQN